MGVVVRTFFLFYVGRRAQSWTRLLSHQQLDGYPESLG